MHSLIRRVKTQDSACGLLQRVSICMFRRNFHEETHRLCQGVGIGSPVAGVLDEPFSQLTSLSGVAVQARQSTYGLEPCPSYSL
jgi:hypothetical protein